MYTPKHFLETDEAKIAALIGEIAMGTLISVSGGSVTTTHIPFIYEQEKQKLVGHVARANPQWKLLPDAEDLLVIFQGPHTYISPSWYLNAGVPTWNYAVVHIHGTARVFDDTEQLKKLVDRLTRTHESSIEPPWAGDYDQRMLEHIIGIEIDVTDMTAKFKLNQNRPVEDRQSVIAELEGSAAPDAQRIAELMKENEAGS